MADSPTTSPTTAPAGSLPREQRPRPPRSRGVHRFALALIVLGGLVLADGVVTLVWQEPISALIATIHQDELRGELSRIEHERPSAGEQRTLASLATERRRIAFLAGQLERRAAPGSAVGRILIPRIGASFVVVKGTSTSALESGPGIYSDTRFPGAGGTTAIAGHRTTFLAPFRRINLLKPGAQIVLQMPYAHITYTVVAQRVVEPTDIQAAVADVGHQRLVLSACTPLFSAAKRLLVYARLTSMVPFGAARELHGALAQPIETPLHRTAPRVLPPVLEALATGHRAPVFQ